MLNKDQFKQLPEDELLMKSVPYVQDDNWSMPNTVATTRFDYKGFDFTAVVTVTPVRNLMFARSIPITAVFKGIPPDVSVAIPLILIHKGNNFIMYEWDNIATAERLVRENKLTLLMTGGMAP